jgi:hypothetical protein
MHFSIGKEGFFPNHGKIKSILYSGLRERPSHHKALFRVDNETIGLENACFWWILKLDNQNPILARPRGTG